MTPQLADLLLAILLLTLYATIGTLTALTATATYLKYKERHHDRHQ